MGFFDGISKTAKAVGAAINPAIAVGVGLDFLMGEAAAPQAGTPPQPPQSANPLREEAIKQARGLRDKRKQNLLFAGIGGDSIHTSPLGVGGEAFLNKRSLLGE